MWQIIKKCILNEEDTVGCIIIFFGMGGLVALFILAIILMIG